MSATGTATVDFGTNPGATYATIDVTGQSGLSAASFLDAFIQTEATADNTAESHTFARQVISCACEYLTATSFRIHCLCQELVWGTFKLRWVTV
jgi:hypothetical protein